jgi:hypothetical protein
LFIVLGSAIGADPAAIPASGAAFRIQKDDAIRAPAVGIGGAAFQADGLFAVVAADGDVVGKDR